MGGQVVGKDFNHCLGCKFVHGVVLVVTSWEISEHVPGKFVDALDDLDEHKDKSKFKIMSQIPLAC